MCSVSCDFLDKMNKENLPKKLLPPIPPKPPRLGENLLAKLNGHCNGGGAMINNPSKSISTPAPGTEAPVYDDVNFTQHNNKMTENVYELIQNTHEIAKNTHENESTTSCGNSCGPTTMRGESEPVAAVAADAVQCPDKCSSGMVMTTDPTNENKKPELETRTNMLDVDMVGEKIVQEIAAESEIGVVDENVDVHVEIVPALPGNSPDSDKIPIIEPDDGSVISNPDNPQPQTSLLPLPIRPAVEGCVSATDDEDPKNPMEFVVSTKTKQQANFEAKPKISQTQGNNNTSSNGMKLIHRSVNGITTIAIDPSPPASGGRQFQVPPPSVIHHVINLPPRRVNSIKRRRKKTEDMCFNKAMRLSQIMMTEYKTNCTDRPGSRTGGGGSISSGLINKQGSLESCKNNVESVGRSVKKRVESWYRKRVKTPAEQLSTDLGLDNFKVPQITKLPFGSRCSTTISSQSQSSQASSTKSDQMSDIDDTDDDDTLAQGQNEFEDLRKLVKSGGDFCKDLAAVLQERSELEAQYAKGLSKLSGKLLKASKEATGSVAHAWQAVAVQIDTQAELHRLWSAALLDEVAKPLRNSTDTQHKIRKSVEGLVEKTTRNLAEWRTAETKSKRQCFSNSKEFEKIQESSSSLMSTANLHSTVNLSLVNGSTNGTTTTNNSVLAEVRARSRILSVPPSDKDPIKLEAKRRKAEEAVRRADIEYYTFCVRSERARLEWEGAIRNGSTCLRTLEEEKLALLKDLALKYFQHFNEFIPKLVRSAESLEEPIRLGSVDQDMHSVFDIRRHAGVEQLLPDFYAEDTSNLMHKERRQEALQKFLYLIKQDLEREKKGAVGIENLAKAIAEAPKVDNAHHDISDKVYYMKSMLMYLEGARCKMENALADLEGKQRSNNSITQYMRYQRDKQGLPQTILKVPTWARDECLNCGESTGSSSPDWTERDRGAGDGTSSNRPDTDFDEFSSEESENVEDIDETDSRKSTNLANVPSIGRCRVIYDYDANMFDELTIRSGEMINVHDKQEDGWWLGELNGVVGIFPATYVELVTAESDTSSGEQV